MKNPLILILILISTLGLSFCSNGKLNNLCEIGSDNHNKTVIVNYFLGNNSPICGLNIFGLASNSPTGTGSGSQSISLSYAKSSYVLYASASSSITATVSGDVSSCVSSTALPSGLSLNNKTCEISGTPATTQSSASYTITASNLTTSSSKTISIRISGISPIEVYGQYGSLTCGVSDNNGSCSSATANSGNLFNPINLNFDSSANLFLADQGHNRILSYPNGSTSPNNVWGQSGSFTNASSGTSSVLITSPKSVAVDSSGGVYVVDSGNHRVLYFPSGSTTASRVYGQYGVFTWGALNNDGTGIAGTTGPSNLYSPTDVALDSTGKIYIVDSQNNRVLVFPSDGSTTAISVYGQFGSLICGVALNDGACVFSVTNANNLDIPTSIFIDPSDNVYISDSGNFRVLYFPAGSTTPTRVYGQYGSFTWNAQYNDGSGSTSIASASNFGNPQGISLDPSGNLFVADTTAHRVLFFPSGSTTATRVYGQFGSLTCSVFRNNGACATATTSADNLYSPNSVKVDSDGNIFISDTNNHRVLKF